MNDPSPAFAAAILGAGRGSRLGRGPKAFVRLGARTFLERIAATLTEVGAAPIVAVLPPRPWPAAVAAGIHPVEGDPDAPMSASVRRALEVLWPDLPTEAPNLAVIVWPVDHPLVRAQTVARLAAVAAGATEEAARVTPVCAGRRGHPIALTVHGVQAVFQAAPDQSLRETLRRAGSTLEVTVEDEGVLLNCNTVAALAEAERRCATS